MELETLDLAAVGARYTGEDLGAQGNVTLGIVEEDKAKLLEEGLLEEQVLTDAKAEIAKVKEAMTDRANAAFEAHSKTREQDAKRRELVKLERRMDKCADNSFRGTTLRAEYRTLVRTGDSQSELLRSLRLRAKFLATHKDRTARHGATEKLLNAVLAATDELEQNDSAQELAANNLPAKQKAYCEAKGRLYLLIKQINTAGQALHAGDLPKAARYNMSILYRNRRKAARAEGEVEAQSA